MAKLLKLRRGSTSQHSSFTGAEGEVTIDTTKDTAVVHDGAQAGGRPLAREDMSNVSSASIAGQLGTDSIATSKIAAGALPTDVTVTNDNVVSNAAIAGTKLANASINASDKLENSSITENKLGSGVVTTAKIANNAVTVDKIADFGQNRIAGRIASGNGSLQGLDASEVRTMINVENGATADQTKSDIDALNINADQVDGLEAGQFVRSDASDTLTGSTYTFSSSTDEKIKLSGATNPYIRLQEGTTNRAYIQWSASDNSVYIWNSEENKGFKLGSTAQWYDSSGYGTLWHSRNDGSGSGLDADTVDGLQASSFLRADTADTAVGDISFSGGAGAVTISGGSDIRIAGGSWAGDYSSGIKIQPDQSNSYFQYQGNLYHRNTAGSNKLTLDQSGNLTASGNVTAYSDARLKTDISTINDALDICGKLRGVSYKWLRDGKSSIGVIAQEVEEVIPEVVLTNVDTDPSTGESIEVKSVDYGKIVGVLINAINELKAELDEHKKGGK